MRGYGRIFHLLLNSRNCFPTYLDLEIPRKLPLVLDIYPGVLKSRKCELETTQNAQIVTRSFNFWKIFLQILFFRKFMFKMHFLYIGRTYLHLGCYILSLIMI